MLKTCITTSRCKELMSKSSVRRRKRRQEGDEKDTWTRAPDNGNNTLSSSDGGGSKRTVLAALVIVMTLIALALFAFRGASYDTEVSHPSKVPSSSSTNAAVHTNTDTTLKQERDTSMDGDDYQVLQVLPHDTTAFTQGLTYSNGYLYESTGYHGQSQLRRIDPRTGQVLQYVQVDSQYFGEGLTHFTNKDGQECLIQLTWEEKTGFIYRSSDLQLLQEFTYETTNGQGWGITYNPEKQEFIVSDGSSWLHFWDRDTLQEKRRVQVKLQRQQQQDSQNVSILPIHHVNELEWDNTSGTILSNVWYTNVIIRISTTGNVEHIYRFDNLYTERSDKADCFNGIALSDTPEELYVTGKYWPYMYRVKLLV